MGANETDLWLMSACVSLVSAITNRLNLAPIRSVGHGPNADIIYGWPLRNLLPFPEEFPEEERSQEVMWIQLANVKPGQKERFLALRRRLLAKAANSPVITAWYTFDMDVGRGVGPLADQGWTDAWMSGVGGLCALTVGSWVGSLGLLRFGKYPQLATTVAA